jgi:CHRD domain
MPTSRFALAAAVAGLFATGLLPVAAQAETLMFHATLNAAAEVPPKASAGTGKLDAKLDTATKALTYTITYSGLTGPATMAHFHGPALPGANAPIVVPFKNPASGSSDTVTLTDAQIADLEAGKWYTNVHTAANPGGEIRGQVLSGK